MCSEFDITLNTLEPSANSFQVNIHENSVLKV